MVSKLHWFVLGLCQPLSRLTLPVCFWPWLVCGSLFYWGPLVIASLIVSCTLLIRRCIFVFPALYLLGSVIKIWLFFEWLVWIAEKLVYSRKTNYKGEKKCLVLFVFIGSPTVEKFNARYFLDLYTTIEAWFPALCLFGRCIFVFPALSLLGSVIMIWLFFEWLVWIAEKLIDSRD